MTEATAPATAAIPVPARTLPERLRALAAPIPPRLRMPLGIAALACFGWLVWWAAFYPGLMTYDSFDYTWESTTGHWVDDHSVFYIGSVWLSLKLTGDYALLTLCQVLGMSAAIGYLAAGLRAFRVRTRWITASVVLLLVLPSSGDFVVYVWKDVPYVIGGVLAFAALTHLVGDALAAPRGLRRVSGSAARGQRRDWLLMGAGLTLTCLSRNNGFLAVLLAGAAMLACMPWLWRRIAVAVLVPVLVFLALDDGLYPALGVTKPVDYAGYTFVYADIAYSYSKAPGTFTAADLSVLSRVAPLEHWKTAGADCYGTDALMNGQFDKRAAVAEHSRLLGVFVRTVRRTPQELADATLCRGTPAWAVMPSADRTFLMAVQSSANGYGFLNGHPDLYTSRYYPSMHVRPLSDLAHRVLDWWYDLGRTPQILWIVWNGATWCWISYLALARLARRVRRREVLAVAAVTVGMQLNVLIATPGPLFRYMAAPFFIGVLTLPLAFSRLGRERNGLPSSGFVGQ
ncbi:hypothetical protein [Streptacidiphilus cavernicola]|uniref:Glycosyltransferase RgtA/B/C/D-like domain-containing protein n=1 Tax=Streptacidiphilus cavernicola TaxID=3342716 RepID=A0ABV6VZF5_9ACTN